MIDMHFECTPCLHFFWVFPLFSSPPKNLKCKTSYWVLTTDSKVHSDICSHFEFGPVPSPDPFPSLLPPSPAPPAIHREFVGVARDGGDINIWPLSPSADLFICFLCETPWLSKQIPHPLNPSVSHQRPLESAAACLVASTHPSAWLVDTDVQPVVTCAVNNLTEDFLPVEKQRALRLSQSNASEHVFYMQDLWKPPPSRVACPSEVLSFF